MLVGSEQLVELYFRVPAEIQSVLDCLAYFQVSPLLAVGPLLISPEERDIVEMPVVPEKDLVLWLRSLNLRRRQHTA